MYTGTLCSVITSYQSKLTGVGDGGGGGSGACQVGKYASGALGKGCPIGTGSGGSGCPCPPDPGAGANGVPIGPCAETGKKLPNNRRTSTMQTLIILTSTR